MPHGYAWHIPPQAEVAALQSCLVSSQAPHAPPHSITLGKLPSHLFLVLSCSSDLPYISNVDQFRHFASSHRPHLNDVLFWYGGLLLAPGTWKWRLSGREERSSVALVIIMKLFPDVSNLARRDKKRCEQNASTNSRTEYFRSESAATSISWVDSAIAGNFFVMLANTIVLDITNVIRRMAHGKAKLELCEADHHQNPSLSNDQWHGSRPSGTSEKHSVVAWFLWENSAVTLFPRERLVSSLYCNC